MLKRWIRPILRGTDQRMRSHEPVSRDTARTIVDPDRVRRTVLERAEVDLVIDAGANRGQYGTLVREGGHSGRLISFEPLAGPFELLTRRAAGDPLWVTMPFALGASETTLEMHVAANHGESSSLLPMLPSHSDRAPGATIVGRENVRVTTVSRCLAEHGGSTKAVYLKLDVQSRSCHLFTSSQ